MVEKERVNSWSCFKEDTSVCGEKGLVDWASRCVEEQMEEEEEEEERLFG